MLARLAPVVASAVLLACAPICADDGAIQGVGGVIELLDEHPTVVMEKMDVVVDFGNAEADVDCTFVFHNTGPALDVRMGFPESGGGADVDVNKPQGFRSFTSWVDGEEVPTTIEGFETHDNREWKRWRVKTIHFEPDQRRVVRVSYPANFGGISTGQLYFGYHLHTGASWKGPIGWGRIRLNFNHDPGRGSYDSYEPYRLDDRFQPCGPRCYEWTAEQFEPARDDNVTVYYVPTWVGIRSLRKWTDPWYSRRAGRYPYIEDGMLWLPVDIVAGHSGADVSLNGTDSSLLRGTRTVQLFANSDVMNTEARPRRLPRPTRVEHERLMVPAAPVLRALGATVTWDAEERTVTISFPEDAPLEARFEERSMNEILAGIPPGYAPPSSESYAADIREHFHDPDSPPWLAIGDFHSNNTDDIALFLQKGNQTGVGIVESPSRRRFLFRWLPGSPHEASRLLDGTFFTVVQTRRPGWIAYYKEGEATPKSGRLLLGRDSFEVIAWGKASTLWYWDRKSREYLSVVTGD